MVSAVILLRLRTTLEQLLPESVQILNVIILTIAEDGVDRIVIVNDDFTVENVAVVVIDRLESPRENITMFCSSNGEKDLKKLLVANLDWEKEIEFAGADHRQMEIIRGLCDQRSESWIYTPTHVYSAWPHTSIQTGCPPPPVSFQVLDDTFAPLLNSSWKFRDSKTEAMIASLATLGKVFGLFVPEEKMPVAWMLMYSQGSLGMLITAEQFRRRGFGSYLVQRVVEEAAKQGVVPYVHIEDDNLQSQDFFRKLGFTKRETAVWINHYQAEHVERKLVCHNWGVPLEMSLVQ